MTQVMLSLEQEAITITKDVSLSLVKDFLDITGFPAKYTPVLMNELQGESKQLNNFFDECKKDEVRTNYQTYAFYEYTETHNEDDLLANNHRIPIKAYPIADPKRQTFLKPLQHRAVLEINLKIRTMDLTMMNRWLSYFKIGGVNQKFTYHIAANYNYAIPQSTMCFIMDSYDRLQAAGETQSLKDYLAEVLVEGVQTRRNLSDTYVDIIVFEKQANCLAMITDGAFFNSKEVSDGIYEVTVPLRFEYYKPLGFTWEFPIIIANQVIDQKYLSMWVPKLNRQLHPSYPQLWEGGLFAINKLSRFYRGDGGTRLFEYDEFFPSTAYRNTQTLTLFPVVVDKDQPNAVINLRELPDGLLPPVVLDYLVTHASAEGDANDSLVLIEIFELGATETRLSHRLDADLNLTTVKNMIPNQLHYCRISMVRNLIDLSIKATTDFLAQPTKALEILKLYDPNLTTTTSIKTYNEAVPAEVPSGRDADLPSLLLVTPTTITSRSYYTWLKKLAHTSDWFVNIKNRNTRVALMYRLQSTRR